MEDVDRRLQFKEIPILMAKLERHSSPQRFNIAKCMRYIKVLVPLSSVIYRAYKRGYLLLVTLAKLRYEYVVCFTFISRFNPAFENNNLIVWCNTPDVFT